MSPSITTGGSGLDPKTRAVLARLCERLGSLYSTQAVKLPYLVDVVANRVLGRRITAGHHETWKWGVVTKEVYRFLHYPPQDESLFSIANEEFSEGISIALADNDPNEVLTEDEREIVDFVADEYGGLPRDALGFLTKTLNTELAPEDWGSNRMALEDEEAYARLGEGWQDFARLLPTLDLDDKDNWSEAVEDDPIGHLRLAFMVSS